MRLAPFAWSRSFLSDGVVAGTEKEIDIEEAEEPERRDRLGVVRAVCALVLLGGLALADVADQLGVSVRAADKQVARGRRHIRAMAESRMTEVSHIRDGGGGVVRASYGRARGRHTAIRNPACKRRRAGDHVAKHDS